MIFRLSEALIFPDPALAEPDGLLAIGGDLSAERLELAYFNGIFPWFNEGDPVMWFSPHERCVIFPGRVHISKSMKALLKSGKFSLTANKAFEEVVKNCATVARNGQDGSWITAAMQEAYIALHKKNIAQSIEVWEGGRLVGGLYGIVANSVFCGESMFSLAGNASKAALIGLCQSRAYRLIDCQLPNPYLLQMGAEMISREVYTSILNQPAG